MVIELPISGEYIVKTTDGVVAKYLGDNLYHFPLEVIQDYGGMMMIQVPEISIDRGDVSGGSVSVKPVYIEILYPNEVLVKFTLYG